MFIRGETLGSLSTRVFETRMATGSELFSLLTCPHTTTFTLVSIFFKDEEYKNLRDNTFLARKMFSSGCRPRLKNARALRMTAILRDSSVAVVVAVAVVRTRPRAIPLAMTTIRKSIYGFP